MSTTSHPKASGPRGIAAEAIGTAFLLAAVVGSGIMAERLAGGNAAIALLANTMATGAALLCLILALGPISGAHLNPVVTLAQGWEQGTSPGRMTSYIAAQVIGALVGVALAHLMFEQPSVYAVGVHVRSGPAQALSEFVATFGFAARDRRLGENIASIRTVCGGRIYHRRLLVHRIDVVCEPRGDRGAIADRYFCRHPARRRACLCGCAGCRWIGWRVDVAMAQPMKTVIFACVHNAGRSQMAAAFFNALAAPDARAISAGTDPGTRVHPEVLAVMAEAGIDLTGAVPQKLTPELASGAAMLITMGCGDECPIVPGVMRDDWPLEDPKGRPLEEVRRIRDEVRRRVERLLSESLP